MLQQIVLQHASSLDPDIVTTLRRCYGNYTASRSAVSGVQTRMFGAQGMSY